MLKNNARKFLASSMRTILKSSAYLRSKVQPHLAPGLQVSFTQLGVLLNLLVGIEVDKTTCEVFLDVIYAIGLHPLPSTHPECIVLFVEQI